MPDTPATQAVYPQSRSQAPGVGFPLARIVTLFSLSCGTVLGVALAPWRGKGTGENALFRSLWAHLLPGDVVLADRFYDSHCQLALLQQRGVDSVFRPHSNRRIDFRTGQRLGPGDHVVRWTKPRRPEWLDPEAYGALPDTLAIREVRVTVSCKGFRTQRLMVATTLVDPAATTAQDLADLYWARWQAELDLRSLKPVLQMDLLRGKTPSMVRKEIWAHLLAYNLLRTVMAQAALQYGVLPWHLSFKGALQTLNAFRDHLLFASGERLRALCQELLKAIAVHRVGNRPGRYEPRARKRRPKPYPLLNKPRLQARNELLRQAAAYA